MTETTVTVPETKEGGDAATAIKEANKEANQDVLMGFNLLAQGKRNLLCGEVPQAVNQLQEACRLLAAKYGETAKELGEAYLSYGTALLDLSRMESGVLGNALQGIDDDEESGGTTSSDDKVEDPEKTSGEEREKITDEVIDAMTEERVPEKKDDKKEAGSDMDVDKTEEKTINGEAKTEEVAKVNGDVEAKTKGEVKTNGTATKEGEAEKDSELSDLEKQPKADTDTKPDDAGYKSETDGNAKSSSVEQNCDSKTDCQGDQGVTVEVNGEVTSTGQDVSKDGETTKDTAMDTDGGEEKKDEESEKEGETEEDEEAESEDIGDEEAETTSQEGGNGDAKDEKHEADDDISNLQLAWEMLELAKVIYSKQEEKEMQLKAAEAYLKLGEVGMETEQYDQAVDDLKQCLEVQKKHLEPESRLIAETHYQIGLACCFSGKYDESISNLKNAVKVIESKLAKLKKFLEESETGKGKESATFDDPVTLAQKEIKDLEDILPDILAKIEDTEDEKKNQDKVKQMVKENVASEMSGTTSIGFGEASTSSAEIQSTSSSQEPAKAADISHLIRKKRKQEEEPEESEEAKKARQESENTKENESECKSDPKEKPEEKKDETKDEKQAEEKQTEEKKEEESKENEKMETAE